MKENLIAHKQIEECKVITSTQKYVLEYYKSKLLNCKTKERNTTDYKYNLKSTWSIGGA